MGKLETSSVTRASHTTLSHKAMPLAATALSLQSVEQWLQAGRCVLELNNRKINLLSQPLGRLPLSFGSAFDTQTNKEFSRWPRACLISASSSMQPASSTPGRTPS